MPHTFTNSTIFVLLLHAVLIIRAARYHVVSHRNERQFIQLKSQYDLEPSTSLELTIDVPSEELGLYGLLPPRLKTITSKNDSGLYGTGDLLLLDFIYTSEVLVMDNPTLTLNTGCWSPSCQIKEVQVFNCKADDGSFSLRLGQQVISNIYANTTQDEFKYKLEQLEGINEVTVVYDDSDDRDYSFGQRICTSRGNNVTVTFENVSLPQFNGDVPNMEFDILNEQPDIRTSLSLGNGQVLKGVNVDFQPSITAWEITKGFQQRDATADYYSGNGTNTITFATILDTGDYTMRLDVKSMNFVEGYIYSNITYANVSTDLPYYGASGPRLMFSSASSLSDNKVIIKVDSNTPKIINVTSPEPDGVYTVGDLIHVYVVFDLPVRTDEDRFYLKLAVGSTFHLANYERVLNDTYMVFSYVVQAGDSTLILDYDDPYSLYAENGGKVYRSTSTLAVVANITLPKPTSIGSLSRNKRLTLNTDAPYVKNITVVTPIGAHTAGDEIFMDLYFSYPVVYMGGKPRMWMTNIPVALDSYVTNAPFNPRYTFRSALPGGIAQINVALEFNWDLSSGDVIHLYLPDFYSRYDGESSDERSVDVRLLNSNYRYGNLSGTWDNSEKMLSITVTGTLPSLKSVQFAIDARSGIFAPPKGLIPPVSQLTADVLSTAVGSNSTSEYPFEQVGPIGFRNLSMYIDSAVYNSTVNVTFKFSVPELISKGDFITLKMTGFKSTIHNTTISDFYVRNANDTTVPVLTPSAYNITWLQSLYELSIIFTSNATERDYSIRLTDYIPLYLPDRGVGPETVTVTSSFAYDGSIEDLQLPFYTAVCAVYDASVVYATKLAGASTAVSVSFRVGPFKLAVSETVEILLPGYSAKSDATAASVTLSSGYFEGDYADYFAITVTGSSITFNATAEVPADELVQITFSKSVGFTVPSGGVSKDSDYFYAFVNSSECKQNGFRAFSPSKNIIKITEGAVAVLPTIPDAAELIELQAKFYLPVTLYEGDLIALTIPEFIVDDDVLYPTTPPTLNGSVYDVLKEAIECSYNLSDVRINRLKERIELTLGENTSANSYFEFNLTSSAGLRAPRTSIPSDAFKLLIRSSKGGYVDNYVMSTTCVGFCYSKAAYSTLFAEEELAIDFTMSLSDSILANKTIAFKTNGFELSSSIDLYAVIGNILGDGTLANQTKTTATLTYTFPFASTNMSFAYNTSVNGTSVNVTTSSSSSSTSSVSNTTYDGMFIVVKIPRLIATERKFAVRLYGLVFPNSSLSENPVVYGMASNVTRSAILALPTIYPFVDFPIMDLDVTGDAGQATTMTVTLKPNLILLKGYYIILQLPGFTLSSTLGFSNSSTLSISSSGSYWDSSTEELYMQLSEGMDLYTREAVITGFSLPYDGVTVSRADLSYAVKVADGIVSYYHSFMNATSVYAITKPSIVYDFGTNYEVSGIVMSFFTNAYLGVDDFVVLEIPVFTSNVRSATLSYWNTSTSFRHVAWDRNSTSITLTMKSSYQKSLWYVYMNVSNVLDFVSTGSNSHKRATISFYQSNSTSPFVTTNFSLPCVGVCSGSFQALVAKAGYSDNYIVRVNFGGWPFSYGDRLNITLPGFNLYTDSANSSAKAKKNATAGWYTVWQRSNITVTTTNLTTTNLKLKWDKISHTLGVSYTYTKNFTGTYALSFEILPEFQLELPAIGVPMDTSFSTSWYSSLAKSKYEGSIDMVQAVGRVLNSSMYFSSRVPNSGVNISVSVTMAERLEYGDQIIFYLRGFTVPDAYIAFFPMSEMTNFTLEGQATYETTEEPTGQTAYNVTHIARMTLTALTSVPKMTAIDFVIPPYSGILIPTGGVDEDTQLSLAVSSTTSPVATVAIDDYTLVGSLTPSELYIATTERSDVKVVSDLKLIFTIDCTLSSGDNITVYLPNLERESGDSLPLVTNYDKNVSIDASWNNETSSLVFTIINGTRYFKDTLEISLNASVYTTKPYFYVTEKVMYPNDNRYTYSVKSSTCPVDTTSIDKSEASMLNASSIGFGDHVVVNKTAPIYVTFVPLEYLKAGDKVRLTLPEFRIDNYPVKLPITAAEIPTVVISGTVVGPFGSAAQGTAATASSTASSGPTSDGGMAGGPMVTSTQADTQLDGSMSLLPGSLDTSTRHVALVDVFERFANVSWSNNEVIIVAYLARNVSVGSTVYLSITKEKIILPSTGISQSGSDIEIALFRADNSTQEYLSFIKGHINTVQTVGYFTTLTMDILSMVPGGVTELSFKWKLSGAIVYGELVEVQLKGFRLNTTTAASTVPISIEGSAWSVTWSPALSKLVFTARVNMPAGYQTSVTIGSSNNLLNPVIGIPMGSTQFTASCNAADAPVVQQTIELLSFVPNVMHSAISFISADESRFLEVGGERHLMELLPGHKFTQYDIGSQFVLDDELYTISGVNETLIEIEEPYRGRNILNEEVPLYTPPVRPAFYHSGSPSKTLRFLYKVQRGDYSDTLQIAAPGTKFVKGSIEGGSIFRVSQHPAMPIASTVPEYEIERNISINSTTPKIVDFTTTTRTGVYVEGEKIDFRVHFSTNVDIGPSNVSAPILLVNIGPYGRVSAYYAAGSGTSIITFAYTISSIDYQLHTRYNLLSTTAPIYQPLRIVHTSTLGYLRRASVEPVMDVDTDFPVNISSNIPKNISVISNAPYIVEKWAQPNPDAETYSSGDVIIIYVRYSSTVSVYNGPNGGTPYLYFDVGGSYGIATYHSMYNSTTLRFSYTVHESDASSHGLHLYCECTDFFKRSFIQLNGSFIIHNKFGESHFASTTLAQSSAEEDLLLNADVKIDNSHPTVVAIKTNLTTTFWSLEPGNVILISLKFSANVTARGMVRLRLKGEDSTCLASLYSGNNTQWLNFRYLVTNNSGTSQLDCDGVDAVDLTYGSILRRSLSPSINATTVLKGRGIFGSLARTANIVIDTRLLKAAKVTGKDTDGLAILPQSSYSVVFDSVYDSLRIVSSYAQEEIPSIIRYSGNGTSLLQSTLQAAMEDPIDLVLVHTDFNTSTFVVSDNSQLPFTYIPTIGRLNEGIFSRHDWRASYESTADYDLDVTFEGGVQSSGASYVALNTGRTLNRAFATTIERNVFLMIDTRYASTSELHEQFQLEYGGLMTRCISVTASSHGVYSLLEALEDFPELRRLGVTTEMDIVEPGVKLLTISVERPLRYPINIMNQEESSCARPFTENRVTKVPTSYVTFRYKIRNTNSMILVAQTDVEPGVYKIQVDRSNKIGVNSWGLLPDSVRLEHLSKEQRTISQQLIPTSGIARIVWSSLSFGSSTPGANTTVTLNLCFGTELVSGDYVVVYMKGFGDVNPGYNFQYTSNGITILWSYSTSEITLTVEDSPGYCMMVTLDDDHRIVLPSTAIYKNSTDFKMSARLGQGNVDNLPFTSVAAVALDYSHIELDNPVPGGNSSLVLSFTLATRLYSASGTSVITYYLPGFTLLMNETVAENTSISPLVVGGVFSHAFSAVWLTNTSEIELTAKKSLLAGTYSVTIEPQTEYGYALKVSQKGISPDDPPKISINSTTWNMESTSVLGFPRVIGIEGSTIRITLHSRPQDTLQLLVISANFSRTIYGPSTIVMQLPFLAYKTHYFASPLWEDGMIRWINKNHTLIVERAGQWDNQTFEIRLQQNMTGFRLSKNGVPYGSSSGSTIAVSNVYGDFLLPYNISDCNTIPVIQRSSLRFYPDVFASNASLVISLVLNTLALPGDVFSFVLYGVQVPAVYNLTVIGSCANATFESYKSTLRIAYSNETESCRRGSSYLAWTIPRDAGLSAPTKVVQFGSNLFKLQWENSFSNTGYTSVTDPPTVGFISSSISFANPYAGKISDMKVKIMLATDLQAGDYIILHLRGFNFTSTYAAVQDARGKTWAAFANSSSDYLYLVAPSYLRVSAITFPFGSIPKVILPSWGIDSTFYDNFTIALQRGTKVLDSQGIQFVQPVGAVLSSTIKAIAEQRYSATDNSSITGIDRRGIFFDVKLHLSGVLGAGDQVVLRAPHFIYNYDAKLDVAAKSYGSAFSGKVEAMKKQLRVTVKKGVASKFLSFSIKYSPAITVPLIKCNILEKACPILLTVISRACPVTNFTVYAEDYIIFAYTSIRVHTSKVVPTRYPTGQPSTQPSGQPSRQPSSQPSSQPTFQPTSSPTSPTGQPSSSPTKRPSRQPTAQPSRQPTRRPTSQPTRQPTSRPSEQPTTQPTSAPSSPTGQPSMQPTDQPSSRPSRQPTIQPTSEPSSQPSSQPTLQPFAAPSGAPSAHPTSMPTPEVYVRSSFTATHVSLLMPLMYLIIHVLTTVL